MVYINTVTNVYYLLRFDHPLSPVSVSIKRLTMIRTRYVFGEFTFESTKTIFLIDHIDHFFRCARFYVRILRAVVWALAVSRTTGSRSFKNCRVAKNNNNNNVEILRGLSFIGCIRYSTLDCTPVRPLIEFVYICSHLLDNRAHARRVRSRPTRAVGRFVPPQPYLYAIRAIVPCTHTIAYDTAGRGNGGVHVMRVSVDESRNHVDRVIIGCIDKKKKITRDYTDTRIHKSIEFYLFASVPGFGCTTRFLNLCIYVHVVRDNRRPPPRSGKLDSSVFLFFPVLLIRSRFPVPPIPPSDRKLLTLVSRKSRSIGMRRIHLVRMYARDHATAIANADVFRIL